MDYGRQWFGHLFKDNYPVMYRMAFSMVENADDAKDAVNQVFTQMWKGKPKVSESRLSIGCHTQPVSAHPQAAATATPTGGRVAAR